MTSANMELVGLGELESRLQDYHDEVLDGVREQVAIGALKIETGAKRRIQRGPKTGRLYQKSNPSRAHRASAPGESPATDEGRLVASITHHFTQNGLNGDIGTNLDYGGFQEHGTMDIEPRPWLFPTFEALRPEIMQDIRDAIERAGQQR